MKLTLRAKGILAFVTLLAYVGIAGYVLAQERAKLLTYALELERVYADESALAKASHAVSLSLLKWQEKLFTANLAVAFEEQVALDVDLINAGLQKLFDSYPRFDDDLKRLGRDTQRLRADPSRNNLLWLIEHEAELARELDLMARQLRQHRSALWDKYRTAYDAMSVIAIVSGLVGAALFGMAMTLFLTRLAADIRRLAARALEVVSGYRGPPVEITRHDEVGDLMLAVNRMQDELRRWERQSEISREQRFHKEKMAAIGSIAAAVAHEINNPIAAIAGLAETLKDADNGQPPRAGGPGPADMILEQTRRIATISRQIAELTAPHSPEKELLDLNALIRNTCGFIAYDTRFRRIELKLELDSKIPAVEVIGDHLTQVLMNLLINAADALEDVADRKPAIRVATRAAGNEVEMLVIDNGKGMSPAVLARAFDEAYTTKPPDKGRGLGLFLCKSLIEEAGNRIELESELGTGTTVKVRLSLTSPQTGK